MSARNRHTPWFRNSLCVALAHIEEMERREIVLRVMRAEMALDLDAKARELADMDREIIEIHWTIRATKDVAGIEPHWVKITDKRGVDR